MAKINLANEEDIKGTKIKLEDLGSYEPDLFTLPSEMPGIVASEEYTGTRSVDTPKRARSGTVRGFNDPLSQIEMGLRKGGNVSLNVIEGVPKPFNNYGILDYRSYIPGYKQMASPGRILDSTRPFINTGIKITEWLGQKASNVVTGVAGVDEIDVELPMVTGEFGDYPERSTPEYKSKLKERYEREQFVRNYEKDFEEKNHSAPYITEALSYAPDLLAAMWGGATWMPKTAGLIEGQIAGSRAEQDQEDVGEAKVFGSIGGYGGAVFSQWMLNSLSPKEKKVVSKNLKDPLVKESVVAMLKYFEANPKVQRSLVKEGKTGNTVLDERISWMREQMGTDSYDLLMGVVEKIGTDGKAMLKETTAEFSEAATIKYDALSKIETDSWDEFMKISDSSATVPKSDMVSELDEVTKDAPPVIKNFTKKLMENNSNALAIKDIQEQKAVLFADFQQKMAGASKKEQKLLKKAYGKKLEGLDSSEVQLTGDQANAAQNLSVEDIVNKIKLLNDKKFLKGGSINNGDGTQRRYLTNVRKQLEKRLEEFEGFDKFDPLYKKAKQASVDKFNTFGYGNTGKNVGRNVGNPELGQVLGETTSEQMKIVENMMSESPAVFANKMQTLGDTLSPVQTKKLKQYYVEKTLNNSLVSNADVDELPSLNAERTIEALRKFTSTEDGRNLIKNSFEGGEEMLRSLLQVEGLTKHMMTLDKQGAIEPSKLKTYLSQLPKTLKALMGGRLVDYSKTRRLLEAYGEETNFDWADVAKEFAAARIGGGAIGSMTAPEGYETEGAFVGQWLGRAGARANLLRKSKVGKKVIAKTKSAYETLKKRKGK